MRTRRLIGAAWLAAALLAGCGASPLVQTEAGPSVPAADDDGRPQWPADAALRAGPVVDGQVTVWWTGAFDADEVVAYRLRRGDALLAEVPGAVTSAVLPASALDGALAVWAVDAGGRVSRSPLTLR